MSGGDNEGELENQQIKANIISAANSQASMWKPPRQLNTSSRDNIGVAT